MTSTKKSRIAAYFPTPAADTRTAPAGMAQGTKVLTLDGALPVEFLTPGDRVITRDAGVQTLRAISARASTAAMIRICQNSLGNGRPGDDIVISADQPILVRDWRAKVLYGQVQAMVPANRLVDGQYIRAEPSATTQLFTLHFDAQHVIYAEGMELASAPALVPVLV